MTEATPQEFNGRWFMQFVIHTMYAKRIPHPCLFSSYFHPASTRKVEVSFNFNIF